MIIEIPIIGAIVLLMLIGVPVGFAFGIGGFSLLVIHGIDPRFAIPAAFRSIESYTLLALPLFILAGGLMREADISRRLIGLSMALLGRVRGGLGIVCIVTCTIFGAISGSASATIAGIGSVMIPEMVEQGYPRGYATGLVSASSILALLIPPSIPMIVFAMTAQISILSAFLSTLIPGIMMMTFYIIINVFLVRKFKVQPRRTLMGGFQGVYRSTKQASLALFMPVLVLGGIYGGVFTPTEAAGMSCLYAGVIGLFIYKTMSWRKMFETTKSSMTTAGVVLILLFFIIMVSRVMVMNQIPQMLTETILGITDNKLVVLLLINVILILMGMLVDDISGNILSAALLLPIATSVGVDPVHFAAISVTNLSLGNITPPCAPMLYLAGLIGGNVPLHEFIKTTGWFIVLGALPTILLTTYVPDFALFLVNMFMR